MICIRLLYIVYCNKNESINQSIKNIEKYKLHNKTFIIVPLNGNTIHSTVDNNLTPKKYNNNILKSVYRENLFVPIIIIIMPVNV